MNTNNEQPPLVTGIAPFQMGPFTAGYEPWRKSNSETFMREYCGSFVGDGEVHHPVFGFAEYIPEIWGVKKDTIYAAISALEAGLEYAQECLADHDQKLGRTIRRNREWAETIEEDIKKIKKSIEELKK